ncbi:predicted protein [Uncinocarpus reesii 1704]|uniref:Apc15p protein n=1 Tax=Uncinocarpus reesii (strain UAMH 1704) TaxID=336963 RepID=C4JPP1_UNCRE|nr:uncharacterized protein UREG_03213 [Uncinocarpus reesii 1704]EEP78367.1 predicted protein [Uncinocarpus reesii 1704]
MLSLPLIEPRDSHHLWLTPSQRSRRTSHNHSHGQGSNPRRNGQSRTSFIPSSSDSLTALMLEERALRIRKQNIASFGYSWIRPAGYPKTMQGIREEEAEREEAANAALEGEMDFIGEAGLDGGVAGVDIDDPEALEGMERDLDDDIPDADGGLVEEGEDGFDEDDLEDEDEEILMERDLDDDVPEGFGIDEEDEDDEVDEHFDDQPDLDENIPSGSFNGEGDTMMERDLDADIPEQEEDFNVHEQEWEHTDTDADEEADEDEDDGDSFSNYARYDSVDRHFNPPAHRLRSSISPRVENSPPLPPPVTRHRETEAQRLFLDRWSGGAGDDVEDSMAAFRSSGMSDQNLRIPRARTRRRRSTLSEDSLNMP